MTDYRFDIVHQTDRVVKSDRVDLLQHIGDRLAVVCIGKAVGRVDVAGLKLLHINICAAIAEVIEHMLQIIKNHSQNREAVSAPFLSFTCKMSQHLFSIP